MYKGISIYLGLDVSLEENIKYLEKAKKYEYERVFTSLHIPETDEKKLMNEFAIATQRAKEMGFTIVADISPRTFSLFGASLENIDPLRFLSVDIWRLDFGFSAKETVEFMKKLNTKIQINASTTNDVYFKELLKYNIDLSKVDACHNFYPRNETGLSIDLFAERTRFLKAQNIKTGAFIPVQASARGPLFAGLPTIEAHRFMKAKLIAKHFSAMNIVDGVMFSDSLVEEKDLKDVAGISEESIELTLHKFDNLTKDEEKLLFMMHTNRLDPSAVAIRSESVRGLCKKESVNIKANNNQFKRLKGTVTVDNEAYGRYAGELQVVLQDLPADFRVNALGRVVEEEHFLLSYIRPGTKFSFQIKE